MDSRAYLTPRQYGKRCCFGPSCLRTNWMGPFGCYMPPIKRQDVHQGRFFFYLEDFRKTRPTDRLVLGRNHQKNSRIRTACLPRPSEISRTNNGGRPDNASGFSAIIFTRPAETNDRNWLRRLISNRKPGLPIGDCHPKLTDIGPPISFMSSRKAAPSGVGM